MQKYLFPLFLPLLFIFGKEEDCPPCVKNDFEYFFDVSFNYWYAREEGLNLAESAIAAPGGQTYLAASSEVLQSEFGYQPGFQIEMGLSSDHWGLLAQYVWVRASNTTDKSAPAESSSLGTSTWSIDDWFLQTTLQGKSLTGPRIRSKWDLNMDMVELLATNKIYRSKAIEVINSVGLYSAWIRQTMSVYLTQDPSSVGSSALPPQPIESSNSSHAWGIGPLFGFDTKYHLPKALRIEGEVAASLLCTQFSHLYHHEDAASTLNVSATGNSLKTGTYLSVQPMVKMGLGVGWTSPCICSRSKIDLQLSYDFYVFWNQNAMRGLLDEAWSGENSAVGNLYLQGLTATALFYF